MSRFVPVKELFKDRHFDQEIVVLCVRWYVSFKLSFRDLVAMMSERDLKMARTTILRWVQHYSPEFERWWKRYDRSVGGSWRMGETYVRVKGEWMYLYRSVDQSGEDRGFLLEPEARRERRQNRWHRVGGEDQEGHVKNRQLGGPTAMMPEIWQAALAG